MKNVSWDAYELFIHVARHGGLSGGAAVTGLSPATISRRMLDFEEAVGRPLFLRSRTGYQLTADGSALFAQILEMEGAARRIENWKREGAGSPLVRIACEFGHQQDVQVLSVPKLVGDKHPFADKPNSLIESNGPLV